MASPSTPNDIQVFEANLQADSTAFNSSNLIVKPEDLEAHVLATNVEHDSSFPGRPPGLHPLAIPPLTIRQKLYILILQTIGAAFLDGAANFGIGCAMYLNAKNVRIWILKNNTVAGDMAITIFIQGVLTFCIASGMVHVDLRKNKVEAFAYPWPDTSWGAAERRAPEAARTRLGRIWRRFNNEQGFSRGLHFFSGSDVNDIFDSRLSRPQFFKRMAWSIWKGSILSVIYFFIIWPISIAIVSPIWAGENIGNGNFTAPIIKGIYGFVYGLLMTPVCAMIAMGSEDSVRYHRAEKQWERFQHPEKQAMKTTAAERVSVALDARGLLSEPEGSNEGSRGMRQSAEVVPTRVQTLRRSLDVTGTHTFERPIGVQEMSQVREEVFAPRVQTDRGWRSVDVHRRRSLDIPRRSTSNRYSTPNQVAGMSRSASIGSARIRESTQPRGLFVPPAKPDHSQPTSAFHISQPSRLSKIRGLHATGIILEQ